MESPQGPTIGRFLRDLWRHGVNGYSAASLVLALIAVLPVWSTPAPSYFGAAALLVVVFYAAYSAWRQAVLELPGRQALSVEAKSANFAAGFDSILPPSPARFDIRLDVTNPALEPLDLVAVEIASFELAAPLLAGKPVARAFGRPDNQWGELNLPFRLQSHERRTDLAVYVELAFNVMGAEDFATKLRNSTSWKITIRFAAETSARARSYTDLVVSGTFDETKRVALARWKQEKRADLVAALGGLQ